MAAAQQARWAKTRGEAKPAASPAAPKPIKQKRELSEAGRKAISEATKRRWALKKAEAQKAQTAVTKKAVAKAPAKAVKKTAGKRRAQKKAQKASEPAATPTP
jgi:ABC-type oligopeptide transport system substrate-binding subunit